MTNYTFTWRLAFLILCCFVVGSPSLADEVRQSSSRIADNLYSRLNEEVTRFEQTIGNYRRYHFVGYETFFTVMHVKHYLLCYEQLRSRFYTILTYDLESELFDYSWLPFEGAVQTATARLCREVPNALDQLPPVWWQDLMNLQSINHGHKLKWQIVQASSNGVATHNYGDLTIRWSEFMSRDSIRQKAILDAVEIAVEHWNEKTNQESGGNFFRGDLLDRGAFGLISVSAIADNDYVYVVVGKGLWKELCLKIDRQSLSIVWSQAVIPPVLTWGIGGDVGPCNWQLELNRRQDLFIFYPGTQSTCLSVLCGKTGELLCHCDPLRFETSEQEGDNYELIDSYIVPLFRFIQAAIPYLLISPKSG